MPIFQADMFKFAQYSPDSLQQLISVKLIFWVILISIKVMIRLTNQFKFPFKVGIFN